MYDEYPNYKRWKCVNSFNYKYTHTLPNIHAHKYAHKTRKCISHTKQFVFRLIRNTITCLAVCFGSSLSSIVQHERSY